MELPNTLHQRNGLLISNPVEVLIGEAWMPAVLCQREDGSHYWATIDLSKLPAVEDWRHGEETKQSRGENRQSDEGVQSRETEKRQAGTRKRTSRKKPQAGDSNRTE